MKNQKRSVSTSMGTWSFDKRLKRRKYISFTGKAFTGVEAMKQARYDKLCEANPHRVARMELRQKMLSMVTAKAIADRWKSTPSSEEELCQLSSWGFPDKVISRYETLGVKSLFPWQVECLLTLLLSIKKVGAYVPAITNNLIYSAPTSGGKTLVAEILMLKRLVEKKGTIFFVVPFVALAEEKTAYFQHIWQDMNIGIKAFHGEDGGGLANNTLTEDVDVAVCTIERANILLTQLYDDNRAHQLSMVVIDEIHMLSDSHRGFLLEVLLSKILYSAKCDRSSSVLRSDGYDQPVNISNYNADKIPLVSNEEVMDTIAHSTEVQIVGMSATLPNISDLSTWLGASLYTTAYRPVHLDIKVCMDRSIYKLAAKPISEVAPRGDDYIHQLVSEYFARTGYSGIEQEYPPPQWIYNDDNSNERLNMAMQETFRIDIQSESTTLSSSSASSSSTSLYAQVSTHSLPAGKATSSVAASLDSNLLLERALAEVSREDMDGLHMLCLETIAAGKSVMLFCNSKRRCEVCAKNIADAVSNSETSRKESKSTPVVMVYQSIQSADIKMSSTIRFQPDNENRSNSNVVVINEKKSLAVKYSGAALGQESPADKVKQGRKDILEELSQCPVGLCPVLRSTIPFGVAYHHAGLTLDERKAIEEGFRKGLINVLCTTSTLSAGVNLPANRVIIRTPKMGNDYISVATFRQMCGRAGRMGLDTTGEAILMIQGSMRAEKEMALHLTTADLDPLLSHLHKAHGGGLEKLLLEMVSCGRLKLQSDVSDFVDCTLMRTQQPEHITRSHTHEALSFLIREQLIVCSTNRSNQHEKDRQHPQVEGVEDTSLNHKDEKTFHEAVYLSPTPFGRATTISGIAPKDAVQIMKPLTNARCKLILKGGLHPVFLVTPPSTHIEPDWDNYEKMLDILYKEHPDAKDVAAHLGICHSHLCQFAFKHPSHGCMGERTLLYKRFYSAILLFTIIQEWPITRVVSLTKCVTRGQLQQLQKDAAIFCGMTVVFCRQLNWPTLACCLEDFSSRLNFGAQKDIVPLVRVGSEVTTTRARIFLKNGIKTPHDIVAAGLQSIAQCLIDGLPYYGRDVIDITSYKDEKDCVDSEEKEAYKAYSITQCIKPSSSMQSKIACERLAQKIIFRAREYLREEADRLSSQT